jgi:hypothetical protein
MRIERKAVYPEAGHNRKMDSVLELRGQALAVMTFGPHHVLIFRV